jgi:putative DNA primase/helicase
VTKVQFDVTAASDWEAGAGYAQVVAALLERDSRHAGQDYVCPTHDDRRPSLGVVDRNGRVLVHCSAGCSTDGIMKALGLPMSVLANGGGGNAQDKGTRRPPDALPDEEAIARWAAGLTGEVLGYWTERRGVTGEVLEAYEIGWNPAAMSIDGSGRKGAYVFPYRDGRGKLLNVKRRWQEENGHKKTFRLNAGADTDFLWPADQLGYGALMLVEGEPDALRLIGLGIPAVTGVTGVGGSVKAARVYAPTLAGKRVFIAFDSSLAGRGAAAEVAGIVAAYADAVYVWDPFPGRDDDSDVSDWLTFHGDDVTLLKRELAALKPIGGEGGGGAAERVVTFEDVSINGTFNPPTLGAAAERVAHLRVGPGKTLWRYSRGVYRADGDVWLETFVHKVLGEEFRANRLREVQAWATTSPARLTVEPDGTYINCRNGLLYWESGRLEAHSPTVMSVTQIGAAYDPDASCDVVDGFVEGAIPEECVEWWWEWMGYLLLPSSKYQRALMIHGPRDTGKSTLLRLVGAFLGAGAISHQSIQALCDDRFAKADLFGKLANIHADLDAHSIQSAGTMKVLISGDPVTAERKYGQPFSFSPYARHIYSANEMPGTSDQSDAYYKRWLVMPMMNKVPARRQDPLLEFKMAEAGELSGVLNRALEGLKRLEKRGRFEVPRVMDQALENYRKDTDTIVGWRESRLGHADRIVSKSGRYRTASSVRVGDAYYDYVAWCAHNGRRPLGRSKFMNHFMESFPGVRIGSKDGYQVMLDSKLSEGPYG